MLSMHDPEVHRHILYHLHALTFKFTYKYICFTDGDQFSIKKSKVNLNKILLFQFF